MNTFLSSAQQAQLDQYKAFARENVAPVAQALMSHEACLKQFLEKVASQGYLGINVPSEFGGKNGTLLDTVLFTEAVTAYDPGLGLTIGNHAAVVETLKKYGSAQQKAQYLPALAKGEIFATLAFSEENAGTDFQAVQTRWQDGLLTGAKNWVVTGDFAKLFLVLARDAAADKLGLYLLSRPSDDSFRLGKEHRLIGLHSAYINDVVFQNAKLEAQSAFVGVEAVADAALYAMSVAKVVLAAAAVGLVESGTELALQHARQREQFGVTIGNFQGVQWKLADLGVDGAAARLLTYRAAWSHDHSSADFARHAAMCKWFAGRAARTGTGEALQICGAAGLDQNNPLSQFYGDGKVMEVAQGTAEFQKMLLVKELDI